MRVLIGLYGASSYGATVLLVLKVGSVYVKPSKDSSYYCLKYWPYSYPLIGAREVEILFSAKQIPMIEYLSTRPNVALDCSSVYALEMSVEELLTHPHEEIRRATIKNLESLCLTSDSEVI